MNYSSIAIKLFSSLILVWLMISAAQMGYASLHFFNAKNYITQWSAEDNIDTEAAYQQALRSIELSNSYHPNNPEYLHARASILEWAVFSGMSGTDNYRKALVDYENAIKLRPLWPWSWGAKIMTKWRLHQLDDEIWQSMLLLDKYGPYTSGTHYVIVDVGLTLMRINSPHAKAAEALAIKHYHRGMANSRAVKSLKQIIAYNNAEEIVANW